MTRTHVWPVVALGLALPGFAGAQAATAGAVPAPLAAPQPAAAADSAPRTADAILAHLAAGNERFASGRPAPRDDLARLRALSHGERPMAIVIACSDARLAPELLFDQPLGAIHAVRLGGAVAAEVAAGTAEMAVEQFDVPLVVLLGHTDCGHVRAALDGFRGSPDGAASCVLDEIEPAARRIRATPGRDSAFARTIQENLGEATTRLVVRSAVLKKRVVQGRLRIVTGVFDVSTGRVRFDDGSAGG
jgi:carbonic anhydrase